MRSTALGVIHQAWVKSGKMAHVLWRLPTYLPRSSPVHRLDARVKIILLFVYSFALFFVDSWIGLCLFAALLVGALWASKLPVGNLLIVLFPVYLILLFTWAFNALTFDPGATYLSNGYGVSPSLAAGLEAVPAVPLAGPLYLMPAGCLVGCFIVIRILLLALASLVVAYSTSSTRLAEAVTALIGPLRRFRVPTQDVGVVFALALRFIPLIGRETQAIRIAQLARGAHFDKGSLWSRLKAWGAVFAPLFIGLFRRAQRTGLAMDARCYGAVEVRTVMHPFKMDRWEKALLVCGGAFCVAISALL